MVKRKGISLFVILLIMQLLLVPISQFTNIVGEIKASTPELIAPVCDFVYSVDEVNDDRNHADTEHSTPGYEIDIAANETESAYESKVKCTNDIAFAGISGEVRTLTKTDNCTGGSKPGTYLWIYNSERNISISYLHIDLDDSITLKNGDLVEEGDVVARISNKGCVTDNFKHIHFAVHTGDTYYANKLSYDSTHVSTPNQWKFVETTVPSQILPNANDVISKSKIYFEWTGVPNAIGYQIELAYLVGSTTNYTYLNTTTNNYSLAKGAITNPENISWRVRAKKTATTYSNWSTSRVFSYLPDRVSTVVYNSEMYRAYKNLDNYIITEVSSNGVDWLSTGRQLAQTSHNISMIIFDNKIYQAFKGFGSNNIYTRTYDSVNGWSDFEISSPSTRDISMVVYNSKLYQTVVDINGSVSVRSKDLGETAVWGSWEQSVDTVFSASEVDSYVSGGFLYQSIINQNGGILVRKFDDISWSTWAELSTGSAKKYTNVNSSEYGTKLYQAMVGNSGVVYYRIIHWSSLPTWTSTSPGKSVVEIKMKEFSGRLYLTARGSTGNLWYGYIDANGFQGWNQLSFLDDKFQGSLQMEVFDNKLFVYVKGQGGNSVYYAYTDGASWTKEWDLT